MSAESACLVKGCDQPVPPEHDPCCSSSFHNKPLCCAHYRRSHFVETRPCCASDARAMSEATATKWTGDAS